MNKSLSKLFLLLSLIATTSCNYASSSRSSISSIENQNCCCDTIGSFDFNSFDSEFYTWKSGCQGMTFISDESYTFDKLLDRIPLTFEATIEISSTHIERAGVIVGNYGDNQTAISFEIYSNGNPRLFYYAPSGEIYDFLFTDVSVNSGKKTHIAVVDDPTTGLFKCYIDGKLEQTLENRIYKMLPSSNLMVGSDARYPNYQYFKGTIFNIALFASIRSEKEINNDAFAINVLDEDLLVAYDTTGDVCHRNIQSLNKKINLIYKGRWLASVDSPTNYSYSMAVIGDTQIMNYKWPNDFHNIYDYVVENKQKEKIAYCFGLGDITDKNTGSEWLRAKNNIEMMNDIVPYSLNRGNHDSVDSFNNYFGKQSDYYSTIEGFYEASHLENSYKLLEIGKQKYLIFTLDYGVPDSVIDWAENVINHYKDYRIIVTTHAYLFRDGTTLDQNDVCPPGNNPGLNNGDQIWEKFVKKHNIDLVLCGHDPTEDIVISKEKNDNGYYVTQVLVNPQGIDLEEPTGMVAMLYFSEDGNTIDIRYYSTVKKMWLKNSNQVRIEINNR